MELSGAGYLYNLSIVGITYAAVGALLMILRQGMGGKTSGFDAYLIAHTVASGFLISIDAMLPPLISLAGLEPGTVWASASALAAVLTGAVVALRSALLNPATSRHGHNWKFRSLSGGG